MCYIHIVQPIIKLVKLNKYTFNDISQIVTARAVSIENASRCMVIFWHPDHLAELQVMFKRVPNTITKINSTHLIFFIFCLDIYFDERKMKEGKHKNFKKFELHISLEL